MTLELHIGNKIYERRRALHLTQTELGRMISVTFQQIQKYEKGLNKISATRIFAISKALNVTVNYFFDGFSDQSQNSNAHSANEETLEFSYNHHDANKITDINSLITLYRGLNNQDTREKLLLFIDALIKD